jgi:uncharacterized protein YndB with AHSA1/START domain
MNSTTEKPAASTDLTLHIQQELQIKAPAEIVFETILDQSGPSFSTPDGKSMSLRLEAWPGGRWWRDLGNNTGHFWGHVQVIKPPTLLEITGPMFMSYPVLSHLQYRLTEKSGTTTLAFSHRMLGQVDAQHREGITKGWTEILGRIKARAER